jgi:hypothetical protein
MSKTAQLRSDRDLVKSAKVGDEASLLELFDRYQYQTLKYWKIASSSPFVRESYEEEDYKSEAFMLIMKVVDYIDLDRINDNFKIVLLLKMEFQKLNRSLFNRFNLRKNPISMSSPLMTREFDDGSSGEEDLRMVSQEELRRRGLLSVEEEETFFHDLPTRMKFLKTDTVQEFRTVISSREWDVFLLLVVKMNKKSIPASLALPQDEFQSIFGSLKEKCFDFFGQQLSFAC